MTRPNTSFIPAAKTFGLEAVKQVEPMADAANKKIKILIHKEKKLISK